MKKSELFEFGVCFEVKGGQISNRYEEITEAQADYIEDATNNHDRLEQENAELRAMLSRDKTAFLNQIELDLIRDSAKDETREIVESINRLLNK